MTLGTTQDGWGYAAVTNKITISAAENIHLRVSWHFAYWDPDSSYRLHLGTTFYNHCGRRKMAWLNGHWLLKYLPKRDTTTSSHRAKSVTWLSRGRVWKETGNVLWTALATTKPHDMQQCAVLWGGGRSLLQQSWWVVPGLLAAQGGQPTHHSGSGCQNVLGITLTHFV